MEGVDLTTLTLQIRPALTAEMVFSTAAMMSLDFLVYLCLVDSLQGLKSNHFFLKRRYIPSHQELIQKAKVHFCGCC